MTPSPPPPPQIRMGLEDRSLAQAVKQSELLISSFLVLERMFEMLISDTAVEFDAKQRQQVGRSGCLSEIGLTMSTLAFGDCSLAIVWRLKTVAN